MEILRYSRDVYGQETLQGVSWDLLWLFFGAAAVFIVLHAVYSFVSVRRRTRRQ